MLKKEDVVVYDYFLDLYGSFDHPGFTSYKYLEKQVDKLKEMLENEGYTVDLDRQYGLSLTVTK